jgi:hypothetical protein
LDLFSKICVRPPYFALSNLHAERDANWISASIPVEQPATREQGPIGAAEAGRHLAILGLCSLAITQPHDSGRHFYLAHRARYRRLTDAFEPSAPLSGCASATWQTKRSALSAIELICKQTTLVRIDVDYHVIPEPMFERLFRKHITRGVGESSGNPYCVPLTLHQRKVSALTIRASLGIVKPEWCAGHFDNLPALPVAIVMNSLIGLAEAYLRHRLQRDDFTFVVDSADIDATNLAFAGEEVKLSGEEIGFADGIFHFTCKATTLSGVSVGNMDMKTRVFDNSTQIHPRYALVE